jgi:hypothetical protein
MTFSGFPESDNLILGVSSDGLRGRWESENFGVSLIAGLWWEEVWNLEKFQGLSYRKGGF